jgi:signal transduction histidine kinase
MELDLEEGHLNAVVTHVLTLVRAQGLPGGVTLHEDLAGDIPVSPMDSAQLSQVLLNLIHNATQAMPGGGELRVTTRQVRSLHGRRLLEMAVSDTGSGIPPEDMERLFTPFFTRKRDGTGLGLAICQRIVQAHGGEIEVHSEPDCGSTFLVRLPMPEARPALP